MKRMRQTSTRIFLVSLLAIAIFMVAFFRVGHAGHKNSQSSVRITIKGPVVRTLFSSVQVAAVMQNGRLVDVLPLMMPNLDPHSLRLTTLAEPILRQEAIAAGSAKIQGVTTATYTSSAYMRSLQGALNQVGK